MNERVQTTVCEMLQQRGYEVSNDDGIIVGENTHEKDNKILVFYNPNSVAISHVKEYISIMEKSGFSHSIVVYKEGITPQASKTIEMIPDKEIEIFPEKKLLYNITKHRLVPKHRCLSVYETATFKRKYGVKIPVLLQTDAVVKFYNFKPNDIIEITRADGIVMYRIVK